MIDEGWVAITIRVSEELSGSLANRLLELGAPGIMTEDTAQSGQTLIAYFRPREWTESRPQLDRYIKALGVLFPGMPVIDLQEQPVKAEDWAENWKQYFHPVEVSPRLLVSPPWEKHAHASGKIPLIIDPGMAFGTGVHATTRLVLCELDKILLARRRSPPARVLDAGTGSGVLAMAAARLGAGEVVGIDIDPAAVAAKGEPRPQRARGPRHSPSLLGGGCLRRVRHGISQPHTQNPHGKAQTSGPGTGPWRLSGGLRLPDPRSPGSRGLLLG